MFDSHLLQSLRYMVKVIKADRFRLWEKRINYFNNI